MKDSDSISNRLKRLRAELGYNQRELAKEFRVSPGAIANWELGARKIPKAIVLLIEIYEAHLQIEPVRNELDPRVDEISEKIIDSIFDSLKNKRTKAVEGQKRFVRRAIPVYLQRHISSANPILRNIQLALIKRIVDSVSGLHGLPVKVVQLASYLDPTITPQVRDVLSTLQDQVRPIAASQVVRVFIEEFGTHPNSLFSEWNPKPFAAASLGQLHLARLKTGEQVAVKVQYPVIADKIRKHFSALSFINSFRRLLNHNDDTIFKEIRDCVFSECDYLLEAKNQDRFREIFAGNDRVYVPKVFHEKCSSRVLTMEYFEGQTLREFAKSASQEQRNEAGRTLASFHTYSIFKHRIMNADPHPGNYLFSDNKVCFLDFGRVKEFTIDEVIFNNSFYLAIINDDRETAKNLLHSAGMVRDWPAFDFDGFWLAMRAQEHHHIIDQSFRFTRKYVAQQFASIKSYDGWRELRPRSESIWGVCINASLWNMLADLKAESNWRQDALDIIGSST